MRTSVASIPVRPTGTVVVIVEPTGERTMLPDRGANAALAPADLPVDELRAATHLHLSGYTLLDPGSRAAGLVALEHAREAGVSVSVDPASAAPIEAAGARAFLDWVANADMLLPNLEEAMALTGAREPEAAAWALARGGRDVVITLGAGGALWSDGEQVVRAAAADAPAPVDSTGAGDAFTAGWLAARLAEPSRPRRSRRRTRWRRARCGRRGLGSCRRDRRTSTVAGEEEGPSRRGGFVASSPAEARAGRRRRPEAVAGARVSRRLSVQ